MPSRHVSSLGWCLSAALHAGAYAALGGWWVSDVTPPSLAGQRSVASVALLGSAPALAGDPQGAAVERERDDELHAELQTPPPELHATAREEPTVGEPLEVVPSPPADATEEPAIGEFAEPKAAASPPPPPPAPAEPAVLAPRGNGTVNSLAARASAGSDALEGDGTTAPSLARNPLPVYPPEAVARGIEGRVVLRLQIADTGRVASVEVVTSSGHPSMDRAAVAAVKQWIFNPAHRDGRPIPWTTDLPFWFNSR